MTCIVLSYFYLIKITQLQTVDTKLEISDFANKVFRYTLNYMCALRI